ncbi:uncharacterized protein [Eurosta solidaginis]|uniref:uncharacterized protein n=1 Tax=Eurosta solidaginis TaxID=178769 RepID=UPI00353077F8
MYVIISYLRQHFEVKVFEAKYFLGFEIEKLSDNSIHIHQKADAMEVLNRFNMMDCKAVSAPMDCNQKLGDFVNDEHEKSFPYREAVGSLMYLAIGTRPDISYAIDVVSRYLERPTAAHINAVKRIMKYIRGTLKTGILYKSDSKFDFVGYSDANYAGDTYTRKSKSGYVSHIGSRCVSWASIRQQSVSTSLTESEYVAACQAVKELVWLNLLVAEMSGKNDFKNAVLKFRDRDGANIENDHLHQIVQQYGKCSCFLLEVFTGDEESISKSLVKTPVFQIHSAALEAHLRSGDFSYILREYSDSGTHTDSSRRLLVREAVSFMRHHVGNYPTKTQKIATAEAIIAVFPNYKIEGSAYGGIELFYNPIDNTGYLSSKLKNFNSKRRKTEGKSEDIAEAVCASNDENLSNEDIEFFKNCIVSEQRDTIKERLAKTIKGRQKFCAASTDIFSTFRFFLFDATLISFDFELQYGENSKYLLQKWENYSAFAKEIYQRVLWSSKSYK